MSDYPIAVVVASLRGWRIFGGYFADYVRQVRDAHAQLIVADGSGGPAPADAQVDDVTWLRMPGATPYQLRQAAYRRAAAPIVAVSEDHCRPAPDWLARVLDAHEAAPDAAVIFGRVENGSTIHGIDWAVYCVGYGVWAPPVAEEVSATPGHANLSWKRWALERLPVRGDRVLEFRYLAALRSAGETIAASNEPAVTHYQCDDVAASLDLMFNNGRAIAGLRRPAMGVADWARALAPLAIAVYRTARTARITAGKPTIRRAAIRNLPLIALLHASHAMGEAVGYVAGPGNAFQHLH